MRHHKGNRKRPHKGVKIVLMVIGGIFLALLFGFLFGYFVMLLWNWLMPNIFGLTEITYWQAVGIVILARLIFGSIGLSDDSKDKKKGKCKDWEDWDDWDCDMKDDDWEDLKSIPGEIKKGIKNEFKKEFMKEMYRYYEKKKREQDYYLDPDNWEWMEDMSDDDWEDLKDVPREIKREIKKEYLKKMRKRHEKKKRKEAPDTEVNDEDETNNEEKDNDDKTE